MKCTPPVRACALLLQRLLPGAARAQGSPTWYLEDIRAYVCDACHPDFAANGAVSWKLVRGDVRGGELDVTADGGKDYPYACPGGTSTSPSPGRWLGTPATLGWATRSQ